MTILNSLWYYMQKKLRFVRLKGNNIREVNLQKWKQSKLFSSNPIQNTLSRLRRGSFHEAEKLVLELKQSCPHAYISQKLSAEEVVRAQTIVQQEIKARNSCCI